MLVSPTPNWVILGGYVAGAVLRGLMVGAIVLALGMLFTRVQRARIRWSPWRRCCWVPP
jgi:ABC-2 type transport system permease protein